VSIHRRRSVLLLYHLAPPGSGGRDRQEKELRDPRGARRGRSSGKERESGAARCGEGCRSALDLEAGNGVTGKLHNEREESGMEGGREELGALLWVPARRRGSSQLPAMKATTRTAEHGGAAPPAGRPSSPRRPPGSSHAASAFFRACSHGRPR
jgi:hypothetical protein